MDEKPHCKLPKVCTSSYLIGQVIVALKQNGNTSELNEFILKVRNNVTHLDFYTVATIARDYVEMDD